MADQVIFNASLGSFTASGKHLTGGHFVQGLELVAATEAGGRIDLAKLSNSTPGAGEDYGLLAQTLRKNTAIALGDADGKFQPILTDDEGRLWCNVDILPAAAVETDGVSAAQLYGRVMIPGAVGTPNVVAVVKRARVSVAASTTDATVIAGVGGKKIVVIAGSITCGATATVLTLESDEGSDVNKHKVEMGVNGGQVLPFDPHGHFETAVGSALLATTGAGSETQIRFNYIEV